MDEISKGIEVGLDVSVYAKKEFLSIQMIVSGECGIFSPKLLDCFWNVQKEFEKLTQA